MRKIILPQILLAALIIGSYYFYRGNNIKNNREPILTKNLVIEKKYEGTKIRDDFFRLIEPTKKDTSHLVTPKLIFRFTEITCGTCVTMGTRLLVNYAKK